MKTKTITTTLALFAVLLALPLVAADSYELYCLGHGETIDLASLCNPAMDSRSGPVNLCMHNLDNGKICPANLNVCNSLGLGCSESTGNTELDITPPTMIINSPIEGEVYSDRSVLLNLDPNEISNIDYQDKSNPTSWKQVCTRCGSYSRDRGFQEGLNDLTFRVRDLAGNEAFFDVAFRVDSKDPRIRSMSPTTGFTSGLFEIEIDELSPETLTIDYGNDQTGFNTRNVNLDTECVEDRDVLCSVQIDLSAYNGQQIQYFAELTDVAGSSDVSNTFFLDVDYSNPMIESIELEKDGKNVIFKIDINEPFFAEAVYFEDIGNNPKEKKLCTSLTDGMCIKKVSFQDGNHEVDIIVRDDAGNEARQTLNFLVDSQGPKIKDVMPSSGFASGLFELEFEETAPTSVELTYGNFETGMRSKTLNLNTECSVQNGEDYFCSTQVPLNDFNGQEVEYMFKVTDVAENTEEDGEDRLKVDISHPVFNSLDYTVDGRYVTFVIDLTEDNLEEITYIDLNDPRAREKRLCSRLNGNICEKRVSFSIDGDHDVTITAFDEAGHATAQGVQFFTDSKDPRISDVLPEGRDFASGFFEVEFKEGNPETLMLEYGNDGTGMRTHNFNLGSECTQDEDEFICATNLPLGDFDGEEIEYMFKLTDRVGQTDEDGEDGIPVDISFPVLNDLNHELDDNRATITLDVTEPNLDKITYINLDDRRPRDRTFCTRLDSDNMCEKRINLNDGQNRLEFTILDDAGNAIAQGLEITI